MSPQFPTVEPYKSRQLVILFKDCPVSGATLGYYGSITRVLYSSVLRNPSRPDLWVYRVFLPHFARQFDVLARELFVTGATDATCPPIDPVCEVQFDTKPASDNEELHGAYRLPSCDWDYFVFRKCDDPRATYQLNLPVEGQGAMASRLCYNVPKQDVLDRHYVLRAIGEFIGIEKSAPA